MLSQSNGRFQIIKGGGGDLYNVSEIELDRFEAG